MIEKKKNFIFMVFQETAAAHTGLQTSKVITDTPASYVGDVAADIRNPENMKEGIITKIRVRLNWANAVTLEALRLWEGAIAGDYASDSRKIFDSDDFVASLGDDDEEIFNVEIHFILTEAGKMWYAPQWSAACGNIAGYVRIEGEVIR